MEDRKKSPSGKAERRRLIEAFYGAAVVEKVLESCPAKDAGINDIYDAFAALWTAQRINRGTALVIPGLPPLDSEGLRMGIWY